MPQTYSLGGLVPIDDPTISGVYPLRPDFDVTRNLANQYVVHKISLKKEQRIRRTFNSTTWAITHKGILQSEMLTLVNFYNAHRHPAALFYFYDPHETQYLMGFVDLSGASDIGRYTCRFSDTSLTTEAFRDALFQGSVMLTEVNVSTTPLVTTGGWTTRTDRYPRTQQGYNFYAKADLTGDTDIVPLLWLNPGNDWATKIGVSDRLVSVSRHNPFPASGNDDISSIASWPPDATPMAYLPRLLDWEVVQEIDASDTARFVVDDSDSVWMDFVKQKTLERAEIRFFTYSPAMAYYQNYWAGYVTKWNSSRNDGTFTLECEGGIQGLKRSMPRRTASTVCPWEFDTPGTYYPPGRECPYSAVGSGGDPNSCDKGLNTPNGCTAHGMTNYFGGLNPQPQTIIGKLNDTGFYGLMRKGYTSTSTPIKSVQGEVIPLVYGNGRQIVEAKIFETRDESEFFVGAGFFSEGPIGEVGQVLLDGQTMHPGYDPIVALGGVGQNIGTHIDPAFRSSETAFASVRRVDEVGFKNPNEAHSLLVEVKRGIPGTTIYWWTGPFTNSLNIDTSNPAYIALNFVLRALGVLKTFSSDFAKDTYLEIDDFTTAALWCDTIVPSLIGTGTESRYQFRGVLRDLKAAIDHLRDILAVAPIDLVWSYGRMALKVRKDDITNLPSFPAARVEFEHLQNIVLGSFVASRREPRFNELKILFADSEMDFQENSVTVYDEAAQLRAGFRSLWGSAETKPLVKQAQINSTGIYTRSQALRLGKQLLYEELGGATPQEQEDAREIQISVPLLGLAVEIGDISQVIHPDLPGGSAWVRWKYWRLGNDWRVDLRGLTVTVSMYDPTPIQIPSSSVGDTQPGIPGGSQGSDGTENSLGALVPPVLVLISQNYTTGIIGVSQRPDLVNFLVVQVSDSVSFSSPVESLYAPTTSTYPVSGTSGVSKWTRAKWRRTSAVVGPPAIPAEESGWSNVIEVTFPKIAGTDIESLPDLSLCDVPRVPVIKAVYGWSEFLEVELLPGGNVEGVTALYSGSLVSGAWPKAGLYVVNRSSDPDVRVEEVDFIMGGQSPHSAGLVSLDSDYLDPSPLVYPRQTIAAATNIATIDTLDPGSPKRDVDYFVSLLGTPATRWVHYVLIPYSAGQPDVLVCPQDSLDFQANVPVAYHCDGGKASSYFGARLTLVQFSATERAVAEPRIEVQIYGRAAAAYSETLGQTFYFPFLQSSPFSGTYGSFIGSNPTGRVRVRFSTGLVLDQEVYDHPNQGVGITLLPTTDDTYQLDDFFVFISTTPFSNTLDAISGDWWDALNSLPAGVHLARVARETNLFASNFTGLKLVTGTTYYVRVGARRFTSFCQRTPDYTYSVTLSGQQSQQIGITSGTSGTSTTDPTDPAALAPIVGPSATSLQLVEGVGIRLTQDISGGTLSVSLDTGAIRESSGFLFVAGGVATVGSNASKFEIVADFQGTFKDWSLRVVTAPTGASLIVDIHKNGTSIFDNGANRPTLTAGSTSATGQVFNVPTYDKGDVFRFDIDQVGAGVAGAEVYLQLNLDSPLRII